MAEKTGDALVTTTIRNGVKDRSFIMSIWTSVCVAQQVHDRLQYLWMCILFSGVTGGDRHLSSKQGQGAKSTRPSES